MLSVQTGSVKGYKDRDISFSVLSNSDEADGLVIFFPGAGYTVQSPIFHYGTGLFLSHSYDVLQVNYSYKDPFYDSFSNEELNEAIHFDSKAVVEKYVAEKSYDQYILLGKSIGTIPLTSITNMNSFERAKVIWLTPLLTEEEVYNGMIHTKNQSLCIIGDKDRFYDDGRYKEVLSNPNMTSKLIPNVNHSLERDFHIFDSITVLKEVMKEMEQFSF
ncbi:alpha/beta hydrolase [Salirhabdus sp. Marseille-P4669]|uniref:alpha/beta hydrolase n=1 Tax=Salirhabdus sp. Marseille-P4669 TaxID=2042310 RepID=UPI000C7B282D|nr:alpha/beta hydrolase [Salirhabdus sp. Marseille-P4669]